jgi:hypothetical protein
MDARLPLSADVVDRTPSEVIRLLVQLFDRIEKVEAENRELKARLGLNSSNSSKRPSSDPRNPKRKPPVPKRGRSRGGAAGLSNASSVSSRHAANRAATSGIT